ncbi:hypothetical protein [Paracidobacterium acidisoli]|nr:hypothetical protein [Paracidobacterium acidisoli]MBT9330271.1 hypothetical protein [Paracidobacterium acidisoli]
MSQAVSELIERSAREKPRVRYAEGLAILDLPSGSRRITTDEVKRLESEEE